MRLHDALFEGEMRILTNKEHAAIIAAHTFPPESIPVWRFDDGHGLNCAERILYVIRYLFLIWSYLTWSGCVHHAQVLHRRHLASKDALKILGPECASIVDDVTARDMDDPALTHGIAATLRTLVIATFRTPRTRVMFQILRRFNPTSAPWR